MSGGPDADKPPPASMGRSGFFNDRFAEMEGEVPDHFARAAEWKSGRGGNVCPKGSELSPLTRFKCEAGQCPAEHTHYFARFCNKTSRIALGGREPASDSEAVGRSKIPHGPFIYWYEDGSIRRVGTYNNGAMDGGWKTYRPGQAKR